MVITPFFLMTTASGVIWKYTIFNISFGWYGEIVRTFWRRAQRSPHQISNGILDPDFYLAVDAVFHHDLFRGPSRNF